MNGQKTTSAFIRNVLVKASLLFVGLNLFFAVSNPMPVIGKLSLYNWLVPGRERFPFGESPDTAYNLSLFNLEAMFASHKLDGTPKAEDEFRVVLIGDSSTWGYLLENKDTLASLLDAQGLTNDAGKTLTFYNLGYPTISLTKDLMILDQAMRYDPDLIMWLVTLESFPYEKQTFTPLAQHNPDLVRPLIEQYYLKIDPTSPDFVEPNFWERTIVGQRRPLADILRLQLYGFMWAATGIDQDIPTDYTPRAEDLEAVESYYGLEPPNLSLSDLAFDVLAAGVARAGDIPVLIVNEPMFVSQGQNSDIRYNFFYPRWVYDSYRELLAGQAESNGWPYLDLWQAIDNNEYTNSAIHLTPQGSAQLAEILAPIILELANNR
jgi:hypothetical protein